MDQNASIRIVALAAEHRAQWDHLYGAYADFYKVVQTGAMRERVWSWLQDPDHELEGLVALGGETVTGIAHFRAFTRPLAAGTGGFLDDLFVDPAFRGTGTAEALIQAISDIGKERGWLGIRWMTAETNYRARGLYDRVAQPTHWRIYDRPC